MKAVILAGGLGTRLSEETELRPKPMVEIGGKPILWHIMKTYSSYGINEFVICLGYKGYIIKEYFSNYFLHQTDVVIDTSDNSVKTLSSQSEKWKIHLIDTGNETMTGGRIKRIRQYIDGTFMLTYGDGVANVNIDKLLAAHKASGKTATLTAIQPEGRFGGLSIEPDGEITHFIEKPKGDGNWINGGFFVCEPAVFDLIENDATVWEREPLETLASTKQLNAFKHHGFWKPMDTLRDKNVLNDLWNSGNAAWKVWK